MSTAEQIFASSTAPKGTTMPSNRRYGNRRQQAEEERNRRLAAERAARAEAEAARDEAEAARAEAEANQRRLAFLAQASEALASSLDYEATLQRVARLAVPRIADLAGVWMVEPSGQVRVLLAVASDPAVEQGLRSMQSRCPLNPVEVQEPIATVLRSGQPVLICEAPDSFLIEFVQHAEHPRLIRALNIKSALAVPIVARGRTLGVIGLVFTLSDRRFGEADLDMAQQLAHGAALAIENARLFKEAQEASRQNERSLALFQTLLAVAPAGVGFQDQNLRYVAVNEALAEINGLPIEAHLGRTMPEIIPDLSPALEPLKRRVLETGAPVLDLEISGATAAAPGVLRHWLVNYYPVRPPGDKTVGVGVLVVDITRRKQAEDERERLLAAEKAARAEAQGALQVRDEFLASTSHELRTPLSHIKGFVSTLRQPDVGWDEETRQDFLAEIEREADRLAKLIADLLDLSRIESGGLKPLERALVSPRLLVSGGLDRVRGLLGDRIVEVDLPDELPPVLVEGAQIERVLANLVENAAKYSPAKSRIRIAGGPEAGELRLRVEDQGMGIPEDYLERVFDKFVRLTGADLPRKPGTGLGLAICRGIVQAHGGRVWAENRPEGGARFVVALPAA
jgi:PAS domain S-box-containing protein